jgi:putative protease
MNAVVDRPARPELLAPAGDWEALRAAVANGANAVYFGLNRFNARHRATNFTLQELREVMTYLHDHNVRGYVTFNTLIFSDELPDAVDFIAACAAAGVDAMIVQDLGIARLIHRMAPTLPVHGSTQMTLTEPRGIEFVRELGISRVILARELSTAEIGQIHKATRVPLEVFVHGALCVAYSGQCLTSESIGGRSANRGQCAQACRLPYDLIVDGEKREMGGKEYLLSPQDLAAYDLIDSLLRIGVCSFKIEGRLKSAQYVAAATQTYRTAIDAAEKGSAYRIDPRQHQDLAQSFSRGFTHGFLDGADHQTLVHARFPKSRGVRVGTVAGHTRLGLLINLSLRDGIKVGDGLAFDEGHPEQDEQGGQVDIALPAGKLLKVSFRTGQVNPSAVMKGATVWKTNDPAVRRRLEQSFARENVVHRAPLRARVRAVIGEPLRAEVRNDTGDVIHVETEQPVEQAQKFPLTVELFNEQFGRMGQTPFVLVETTLTGSTPDDPPEAVMVPKSVLNELRRKSVEALRQLRVRGAVHELAEPQALANIRDSLDCASAEGGEVRLSVLVRSTDQLHAVLNWPGKVGIRPDLIYCDFEDVRRYKEAIADARSVGMTLAPATLRVVKPSEEGLLRQIADLEPDAVLVRNLAAVSFYAQQSPQIPMYGDYSLNVANEITADIFASGGLVRMVPSYDLNWQQLAALLKRFDGSRFETVVHQHMPMFHMEHCVFAHTLSKGKDYRDCGRPCDRHRVELRDRVGQLHPLLPDVGCRNTLFNAAAQSAAEFVPRMRELGVSCFRVELLRESADESISLLDRYARVLRGVEDGKTACRQLRVLNQLGVTRGTLDFE